MYDFANSGYTTVVVTAVFGAYFVSVVGENRPWATFAWTAALSLSYALILVSGPLIGAWPRGVPGCARAGATRRGRVRASPHRAFELLLRHRREPDRRVSARARRLARDGPRLRLGLGFRLPRRPRRPPHPAFLPV